MVLLISQTHHFGFCNTLSAMGVVEKNDGAVYPGTREAFPKLFMKNATLVVVAVAAAVTAAARVVAASLPPKRNIMLLRRQH
jgi:hypothetical protein